jgi:hypothetical protein
MRVGELKIKLGPSELALYRGKIRAAAVRELDVKVIFV